jgi:putative zinc finger protein
MIRHVSTEELSAYLDSELGFAEVGQLEAHCAMCAECGGRLAALRRVVHGLGRLERAEPPAALRQQIRRQVQAAPPAGFQGAIQSALDSLRFLLFPIRPAVRASAALGLAVVAGLFAIGHGLGDGFLRTEPHPRQETLTVETFMGVASAPLETTSEVAGREFVLTDMGWVQRGLEWKTPEAQVDARSPEGRALLTKYSDLEFLLADGSSVVLRYNLETVEIRRTPPVTRVLGDPSRRRQDRGSSLSA